MAKAKLTFMGGIHPYDGKAMSREKPVKTVLPKGDLVYPLSQHIGAPAKPVVQKGDRVLTGQKIATGCLRARRSRKRTDIFPSPFSAACPER